MKYILIFILFTCSTFIFSQSNHAEEIKAYRTEQSKKVLQGDLLNGLEKAGIDTLDYFETDSEWRIQGEFIKDKGKKFKMPTSTDRTPTYRRYGWVCLEKDGQPFRLAVYQNMEMSWKDRRKNLFIPFKDATAPDQTYGGGRYIDVSKDDNFLIDFNKAYNPYCVYSHRYSCPIPPEVNRLEIAIEAGEKLPILKRTDK